MNVTVSTYTNPLEAHIIRGRLEAEGIPTFVVFEHHIWVDWAISLALGGVQIQVPSVYIEEANKVLFDINSGKYQTELEDDLISSDPTHCPQCDSIETIVLSWSWKLSLLVLFLLSIPIPYSQHLMKCNSCTHTWLASEQRPYPITILIFAVLTATVIILLCYYFVVLVALAVQTIFYIF